MSDYETMTDRELSVAVAERVMGYDFHWGIWKDREARIRQGGFPNYATDPVAMMSVIERLRKLGWIWTVDTASGEYFVAFTKGDEVVAASSSSLSRAVCEAAMQAVDAGILTPTH